MIAGWYPAYRVQNGDRFLSDIGCLVDSRSCDVTFYLDYEVHGQPARNLSSWHEVYDRQLTRAEVDLSSLAGQSVTFILRVENNAGAAAAANAIWLAPSIRRSGGGQPIPPEDNTPVRAARQVLANALGIELSRITTVSVEPAYWPDTCLGIPQPGVMCAQVQVYGFRVILTAQGRFYEVRTDQNAATVYWMRLE